MLCVECGNDRRRGSPGCRGARNCIQNTRRDGEKFAVAYAVIEFAICSFSPLCRVFISARREKLREQRYDKVKRFLHKLCKISNSAIAKNVFVTAENVFVNAENVFVSAEKVFTTAENVFVTEENLSACAENVFEHEERVFAGKEKVFAHRPTEKLR